jgi:hypothetical protein
MGTAAVTAAPPATETFGTGTAALGATTPAAVTLPAVASLGWFCFCQASQSMISEKLNTNSRINRRLSITVSAVT